MLHSHAYLTFFANNDVRFFYLSSTCFTLICAKPPPIIFLEINPPPLIVSNF